MNKIPEPMYSAYCSYLNCTYTEIAKVAFPGQLCPTCGKPLSWAGKERKIIEETLEDGTIAKIKKWVNKKPYGKWKP